MKDLKKAEAFVSSETLKEAIAEAGVTCAPEIVFYRSVNGNNSINTSNLVTIITHLVSDYSTWKEVYDFAGELRKKEGLTNNLILRSLSNKNIVTVMGLTSSVENFNRFLFNPKLKTTMDKAEVISEPKVRLLL